MTTKPTHLWLVWGIQHNPSRQNIKKYKILSIGVDGEYYIEDDWHVWRSDCALSKEEALEKVENIRQRRIKLLEDKLQAWKNVKFEIEE